MMNKLTITLGLLVMLMGMSMPSAAFAAEVKALANAEQLHKFTTAARERCGGDTCPSAALLSAFTAEAEKQGLLGSMSKDDYAKLLQNRYPLLTTPQVAISAIEDLAITGLVLPDARTLGYTATPSPALPTAGPAEVVATKSSANAVQSELTAAQNERAKLQAMPVLSKTQQQQLVNLPGQIKRLQGRLTKIEEALGNKVEVSVYDAFLKKFGFGEGQTPIFATTQSVTELNGKVTKHERRLTALENAPAPKAEMPQEWKIAIVVALIAGIFSLLTIFERRR